MKKYLNYLISISTNILYFHSIFLLIINHIKALTYDSLEMKTKS